MQSRQPSACMLSLHRACTFAHASSNTSNPLQCHESRRPAANTIGFFAKDFPSESLNRLGPSIVAGCRDKGLGMTTTRRKRLPITCLSASVRTVTTSNRRLSQNFEKALPRLIGALSGRSNASCSVATTGMSSPTPATLQIKEQVDKMPMATSGFSWTKSWRNCWIAPVHFFTPWGIGGKILRTFTLSEIAYDISNCVLVASTTSWWDASALASITPTCSAPPKQTRDWTNTIFIRLMSTDN